MPNLPQWAVPLALHGVVFTTLAAGAAAQSAAVSYPGSTPAGWGHSVASVRDVDGDDWRDIVVGAPFESSRLPLSGEVRVLSGATGAVLHELYGAATSDLFGWAVASVGDLDGDGLDEFAVGSPNHDNFRGRVTIYSSADASLLFTLNGQQPGDRFGWAIAGLGDANFDGVPDLAVGAWGSSLNGNTAGAVFVHSGANGALLRVFTGDKPFDRFGTTVAGPGDVNGDGRADVAVGCEWTDLGQPPATVVADVGSVYVYSLADGGTLLWRVDGTKQADSLGTSIAAPGDVDGDGFGDVLAGCPGFDPPSQTNGGAAFLYSGANGSLLQQMTPSNPSELLGGVVSATGDFNGDGVPDFAAASPTLTVGTFFSAGQVRVQCGATANIFQEYAGNATSLNLGQIMAPAGDLDGDGFADLLFGLPTAVSGGVTTGRVELWRGVPWKLLGGGIVGQRGKPLILPWGSLESNSTVVLKLIRARPSSPTVAFLGVQQLGLPFKGGVLVPQPSFATPAVNTSNVGVLQLGGPIGAGVPSGFPLYAQFWVADAIAVKGFAASDGTVGTTP